MTGKTLKNHSLQLKLLQQLSDVVVTAFAHVSDDVLSILDRLASTRPDAAVLKQFLVQFAPFISLGYATSVHEDLESSERRGQRFVCVFFLLLEFFNFTVNLYSLAANRMHMLRHFVVTGRKNYAPSEVRKLDQLLCV